MTYTSMENTGTASKVEDFAAWSTHLSGKQADGFGALTRIIQGVFGVAACAAALSLWLVPGSDLGLDMMALKGALTCGLVIVGFVLWRDGREERSEVEVDFEAREVRVMGQHRGQAKLRKRYDFSELGAFDVVDGALFIRNKEGQPLAVVPLEKGVADALSA
ncbi:MAG: hypothetical protein AAFQ54_01015 [Pseudomonadota bacterium]